jgi:HlyD family secretion protein
MPGIIRRRAACRHGSSPQASPWVSRCCSCCFSATACCPRPRWTWPRFSPHPTDQADPRPSNKTAGNMRFQASGWIEPDPLPIKATALIDGVIETVHVLEGQAVKKGEPLATFIDEDFQLALAAAEETHRRLAATRDAHRRRFPSPAETRIRARHRAGGAHAPGGGGRPTPAPVRHAQRIGSRSQCRLRPLATRPRTPAKQLAAEAEAARPRERKSPGWNSKRKSATPKWPPPSSKVEQAKLALKRTRIVSPVDGRVLRLLAAPGQKKRSPWTTPTARRSPFSISRINCRSASMCRWPTPPA